MSNASDYRQELTDKIISLLEKGTAPWQQDWQSSDNRLFSRPYNPNSEKPYRGINSLSLTIQSMDKGYSDSRWCTFKQATDKGWHVKAGERGTKVEYWKFTEKTEVTDNQGNKTIQETELKKPQVFRAVVFNAEHLQPMMKKVKSRFLVASGTMRRKNGTFQPEAILKIFLKSFLRAEVTNSNYGR